MKMASKTGGKPRPVPVEDDLEILRRKQRKREPKLAATDTRKEHRLSNGSGLYWTGPAHGWPLEGEPAFNRAGQKWASESRALQLWAEYNLARAVQDADWPDLTLETFEITVKHIPASQKQPRDLSKMVHFHRRFDRYNGLTTAADRLLKDGFDFKYMMEYRGEGDELPDHLKMRVSIVNCHSYGMSRPEGHYITVAFLEDKDMVYARVALGDRVQHIINDKAETVYKRDDDPVES